MPWAPKTHRQTINERQRRGGLDPRPSACKRGYGRRWQRLRKLVLARDPICKKCNRELSYDADHIVPKSEGGTDDLDNLQGMCHSCHSGKSAIEDGGFGK